MDIVTQSITVVFLLALGATASVRTRKLTPMGGIAAFVVGLCVYAGSFVSGLVLLAAFFAMGVAASAHKKEQKATMAAAQDKKGRTSGQVFANGGIAALAGLLLFIFPQCQSSLSLVLAAALASATADTLASELGIVYGKRTFDILTFRKAAPGADGVVSIEGLWLGAAGAFIIGLLYYLLFEGSEILMLIITLAGTVGNLADSILGASLERKGVLGNNLVNLLNTFFAALCAWTMFRLCPESWLSL